jgi:hypothetical protein
MLDKGSRSSWDTEVVGALAWTRNRIDDALAEAQDEGELAHRKFMATLAAMNKDQQRQTLVDAGILTEGGAVAEPYKGVFAERQDSATDVVEWRVMQDEDGFWEAYPADGETELDVLRCENGLYRWSATVEREEVGFCATEAEAKSAAIAAARGMR